MTTSIAAAPHTTSIVDLVQEAYLDFEGPSTVAFSDYLDDPDIVWTIGNHRFTGNNHFDEATDAPDGYTWFVDERRGDSWQEVVDGSGDTTNAKAALATFVDHARNSR